MRMNNPPSTRMNSNVGRRGITSVGTAMFRGWVQQVSGHDLRRAKGERQKAKVGSRRSTLTRSPSPFDLFDRDFSQQIEVREHLPRPQRDAGQGILGQGHREAGLFAQALVEVLQ